MYTIFIKITFFIGCPFHTTFSSPSSLNLLPTLSQPSTNLHPTCFEPVLILHPISSKRALYLQGPNMIRIKTNQVHKYKFINLPRSFLKKSWGVGQTFIFKSLYSKWSACLDPTRSRVGVIGGGGTNV